MATLPPPPEPPMFLSPPLALMVPPPEKLFNSSLILPPLPSPPRLECLLTPSANIEPLITESPATLSKAAPPPRPPYSYEQLVPDATARVTALQKGEIDILIPYAMPFSEMDRMKQDGFMTEPIFAHDGLLALLMLNLKNEYLSNQKVRYAIAHAIDKKDLNDKAFFGLGRVAVGPIPSSIPWAFNENVKTYEYDPEKANKILDEAGFKKGPDGLRFSLRFPYVGARPDADRTAQIIRAQLRDVGIDVQLQSREYASVLDEGFKNNNFDLMFWSLTMGPNPSVGTARIFITSQIKPVPFTNAMNYSNPRVDDLFENAAVSTSLEEASNYFKEIQEILVEDLPVISLLEIPYPMAWSTTVNGLPEGPYWTHRLENVGFSK